MQTTTTNATASAHGLQRPRFFPRQLVTPAELNLGLDYVLERLRRHNRLLHGCGVICGLKVCRVVGSDGTATPWQVALEPGAAIDCCGNDVTVDCERIVDLRVGVTTAACGDPPGEVRDPWCSDVWTGQDGGRVWIAVCYAACRTRPVRTQPTGCGCDDTTCEYSRWVDGYEVRVLTEAPASCGDSPPTWESFVDGFSGPLPDCLECPDDPCVALAVVDVAADGTVTTIDNCSCRRLVFSAASFWWRCAGAVTVTAVTVTPDGPYTPKQKGITLKVEGTSLSAGAQADLGQGAKVRKVSLSDDGSLQVIVDLTADAKPGDRTLTITAPDCSTATYAKALTVSAPTA
jgi:hypothetical protein